MVKGKGHRDSDGAERRAPRSSSRLTAYQVAIAGVRDAVVIADPAGRVALVNPPAAALLGWDVNEAQGQPFEVVVDLRVDSRRIDSAELAARARQGADRGELEQAVVFSRSGRAVNVAGRCVPVPDGHNGAVAVVLLLAVRAAESEEIRRLRRDEHRFRVAFERSPHGRSMTAFDGTLRANQALCDLLGYSEVELRSRTWQEVSHPDDIHATEVQIARLVSGEQQSARFEKRYLHKTGRVIWCEVTTALHRDERGEPAFYLSSVVDITERKTAEQERQRGEAALRASEARYRALFDNMNEGFYEAELITDDAGKPVDLRFLDVNPAHRRIFGLPRERVVGRTIKELFPGIEEHWLERAESVARTGRPAQFEGYIAATDRHYANSYFSPAPGRIACIFSDVTERKQAAARTEAMARFPAENPNPVLRVQVGGTIIYANASSKPLLVHWGTGVGRPLPSSLDRAFQQALSGGAEVSVDVHCGERIFSLQIVPVRGLGYANIYGRDVTQRERALAAELASEQRYRSLFASMLNGLAYCRMIYDEGIPHDFVYLAVNPAFESLTGLRNVVGKRVSEVIPGLREADPQLFESYGRVVRTGRPEQIENYVPQLAMWFTISVFCPEPEHFVAVFDVITARKRMEMEQRATIKLLAMVNESQGAHELVRSAATYFQTESGCEAVGIRLSEGDGYPYFEARGFPAQFVKAENDLCDRDGDGRVLRDVSGNPLIACMCGNVICGRFDPSKPFFTANGSFWTNSTTQLLASTTEADRQVRTRNRCNGAGYESVALLPLRVGEERLGLVQLNDSRPGRFTPDLIALWERLAGHLAVGLGRARAEEALRRHSDNLEQAVADRTRKLEEANQEMEAFSYSVSHDLRAPLRAIHGFTRILADEHGQQLSEEGRRVCSIIRTNTERMGQLIEDLLAFSRLGRAEIESRAIDMRGLARATFDELVPVEARQRIDFRLGELPTAFADRSLMRQVWQNLLGNAIKFSSKRDRAVIDVTGEVAAGEVSFAVRDNGAGFDPQYAHKLFRVFERLHSTREFAGTGVGLALVQQIIRRHGGRVWAEGEIDRGARFCFALPQVEA